jgi:hypothetical protein
MSHLAGHTHAVGLHSRARGLLAALLALSVGALVAAPAALAGHPTGEYKSFNDCPLGTSGVTQCVYAEISSGELPLGSSRVPIVNTIVLQGGLIANEKEETFVNTTEGQTLSKTEEKLPGGLLGIIPESESSKLTVTMELVGAVALNRTNLTEAKGTALKLPVRLHLKNLELGEACYVGSSTSPITLNLTTGATSPPKPNKAITGKPGERESKEAGNLVIFKNDSLVENAFSVPGASGCGTLLNPIIDEKFKLPSAAGNNTAVLNGTSRFASAEAVRKSE